MIEAPPCASTRAEVRRERQPSPPSLPYNGGHSRGQTPGLPGDSNGGMRKERKLFMAPGAGGAEPQKHSGEQRRGGGLSCQFNLAQKLSTAARVYYTQCGQSGWDHPDKTRIGFFRPAILVGGGEKRRGSCNTASSRVLTRWLQ